MDLLNGAWKTYRLSMKGTGVIADGKDFVIETMPPRLTFTRYGASNSESVALDELTGERFAVKFDAKYLCEGRLVDGTPGRRAIAGVIKTKDGADSFVGIEDDSPAFSTGQFMISSAKGALHGKNLLISPAGSTKWKIELDSWTAEGEPPSGDTWEPTGSGAVKFFLRAVKHKVGGVHSFVGFVQSAVDHPSPGDEDSFVAVRVGPGEGGEGESEGEEGR